jgi:hypothetical protein
MTRSRDTANIVDLPTTKGDLYAATAASTPTRLGVGTNGQVLTADSTAATGIAWATAAAGGWTLISTTTLSGTSTTISSVPTTYRQYMIVGTSWSNGGSSVNDSWFVQLNSGVSWGYQTIYNGNSGTIVSGGGGATKTTFPQGFYNATIVNYMITRPASGNTNAVDGWIMSSTSGPATYFQRVTGYLTGTSAWSTITISTAAGTSTISGTAVLYGMA